MAFNAVALLLAEIFGQPKEQTLVDDIRAEDALPVVIAWGVLVCVLAPFVEEVFFRGFMFTVFARRMGVAWAALLDGVVFGIGHASGTVASGSSSQAVKSSLNHQIQKGDTYATASTSYRPLRPSAMRAISDSAISG